jgi:parvulin-like peptidyl-prolyl isomerase
MNSRPARTKLAVVSCAAAALAAVVAGCGGVPGDAVATVNGNAITKQQFNHWMTVAAKSGGQAAAVPQPPAFKACIAAKRKALPKPGKGQPKTTDAQLKTQCQQEYSQLRDQVLQLLISFQWIEGEAKAQGIKVSDAEVKKQFDTQKKASFPKESDYQKFLKQSGQTEQDILMRVKLDVLSNKIRTKVTKGKDQVTNADIQKYYDANKARFSQPERRNLLVVETKTQAKAQQAKKAVQSGTPWAKVAKQYSIDPTSKAAGGKLPSVAKGQQEKAFDSAIFSAPKNKLEGPVKTQFGYYIFKVTGVSPASQQSEQQASTTIKQLLSSQKQQKALDTFVKNFQKKWRAKTDCRKGYQTTDCKNGPKATPTPTAPAGGAPTPAPTQ